MQRHTMDILAVNDQENLVHNLQAGAVGKPLNAGLKGFNAKTPGNKAPKTPFKVPLNDENAPFKTGKSILKTNGKGNENLLMAGKKGGKLDENAFVTPAGPRTRAPLGMKTTNAKTKAFQTPAPLSASAKTQKISPRLRRPKVKVHQPEVQNEEPEDELEIEYMPPKEIPLPDDLGDYPTDWKFPMFEGKNFTRGMYSTYHNPIEDDGRTRGEREFEESLAREIKKRDEEFDKTWAEMMAKEDSEIRRSLRLELTKKPAPKDEVPKKKAPAVSTLKARSAAAALSPPPKPNYAAPTASTKSRIPSKLPSSLISSKKTAKPTISPLVSRHAAATTASKTTIGYSNGRNASTSRRQPLSNITRNPPITARRPTTAASTTSAKPRGAFSRSSSTSTNATLVAPSSHQTDDEVHRELELMVLRDDEDDEVNAWMSNFSSQMEGEGIDDELDGFQLQLPEGL
ncbi:hypothetical protein K469DRAFT_645372 [Zopfia rhizophila CBS 207.26]|uniref:Uncharacterized protein n=1 Tax=Zopfia rhizophila CBS 207.26 TaxID=1314779 RepID=A0A6A6DGG3_9PEZI|nr:hypothetical protein K469DRAFT_645372 [Zopfia rhizophila CBS 207.26]